MAAPGLAWTEPATRPIHAAFLVSDGPAPCPPPWPTSLWRVPGLAGHAGRRALNDRSRPLNAQRSTNPRPASRRHQRRELLVMDRSKAGTEAAAAADDDSAPDTTTGMEATRCSRDRAQGTRRHHRGAGGAGSPGGGSGAGHAAPSIDARPLAGSCPTDPTHVTNRPDLSGDRIRSSRPRNRPHPRRYPCRPEGGVRLGNDSRSHVTDRLLLLQRRCRARCLRTRSQEEGACCSRPCARSLPSDPDP